MGDLPLGDGIGRVHQQPPDDPRTLGRKPVDRPTGGEVDFFKVLNEGDVFVHYPYESFATSTGAFLAQAAADPDVLAIKQTLYRTSVPEDPAIGGEESIVRSLMAAAEAGKQVVVLVELKARFDEAANIGWAKMLENAGAHVVYGMERLKTHVKLGMVVREEAEGIRRYVHVATGNYHVGTARLYEDLGILSCDPELAESVAAVFNELTGSIRAPDYGQLLVAPHNLRQRFVDLIRREAEHSKAGRPCGIRAKMNQLQDSEIIKELYAASRAGVPITLNVRGMCCMRAGVPGLSENVRIYSVLGRFLEHGRIYRFENGGNPEYYIGSADWMRRNLDSRMETIMPVKDEHIKCELEHILNVYETDNITAWDMLPDNTYLRRLPGEGEEPRPSQETFIAQARESIH